MSRCVLLKIEVLCSPWTQLCRSDILVT